jgi:hypothetical protein
VSADGAAAAGVVLAAGRDTSSIENDGRSGGDRAERSGCGVVGGVGGDGERDVGREAGLLMRPIGGGVRAGDWWSGETAAEDLFGVSAVLTVQEEHTSVKTSRNFALEQAAKRG